MDKSTSEVLFIAKFDSSKYIKLRGTAIPKRGQMFLNNANEVMKARVDFKHEAFTIVEEKPQVKTLFYIGQPVQSQYYGKGKVIEILTDSETEYPVRVQFANNRTERYTPTGKYFTTDSQYDYPGERGKDITPVYEPVPVFSRPSFIGFGVAYGNTYRSEYDARQATTGREIRTAEPVLNW
jgi:hypothetical protein